MSSNEHLVFQMGLYEAKFPLSLKYAETHFWFRTEEGRTKIGFTAYANRLLSELFRIDWKIAPGDVIQTYSLMGEVESTKATSELYAPMSGRVISINSEALQAPSMISVDPYNVWLLEIKGIPLASLNTNQYVACLSEGWEETVQFLKGQV